VWAFHLRLLALLQRVRARLARARLACAYRQNALSLKFLRKLKQLVRARNAAVQLRSQAPRALDTYDVGFDALTRTYSYRDENGRVSTDHPAAACGSTPMHPLSPPAGSHVLVVPEETGGHCYLDATSGLATWDAPAESGPLASSVAEPQTSVPTEAPPQLDASMRLGTLDSNSSSWATLYRDACCSIRGQVRSGTRHDLSSDSWWMRLFREPDHWANALAPTRRLDAGVEGSHLSPARHAHAGRVQQ